MDTVAWRYLESMDTGEVRPNNPFMEGAEDREPVRRFRGRLASGVTIWTSGAGTPTGLTISSMLVAEGAPSSVIGLVNDTSDLFESLQEAGRFVIHILDAGHYRLADRFAGRFPSPGGLFSDVATSTSEWGPVMTSIPDRAFCSVERIGEAGFQRMVVATIDKLELSDLDHPLVYFRGRYRALGETQG